MVRNVTETSRIAFGYNSPTFSTADLNAQHHDFHAITDDTCPDFWSVSQQYDTIHHRRHSMIRGLPISLLLIGFLSSLLSCLAHQNSVVVASGLCQP
jgi:hypothetical protein